MSLISGKYWTGDPDVKPEAWGPVEDVKAAIRENADRMGIPMPFGYWPILEAAGNTAYDYSGNNQHIALTNTTWSRLKGSCLYFNGTNSYGYVPLIKTLSAGADLTHIIRLKEVDTNNYEACVYLGNSSNQTYVSRLVFDGSLQFNRHVYYHGTVKIDWLPGESWGDNEYIGEFQHFACGLDSDVKYVLNEKLSTSYPLSNPRDLNRLYWGAQYGSSNFWNGYLDTYILFEGWVSDDNRQYLYDNPYALIQHITRRFYSIPGGEIAVISAACTDGFTFADSATKTAILQAAAVESINLSDSDENVAQFISALVDSFTMADLPGRIAAYPVSVSDAFSVSDSTAALQKVIALVSDNVTFSDVSVVRADLTGIAEDNVQFSETLLAALQAQAIVTEIINLSDITTSRADLTTQVSDEFALSAVTTADVLGVLTGLCSDTFNVSDAVTSRADLLSAITDALGLSDIASALLTTQAQATDSFSLDDSSTWASIAAALVADGFVITGEVACRADLVAALVDSMNLSDASATILTAYATATDGFTVSDTAFWAGITQAIASDSFTVSGSVTGLIKLLAQAAETINFSDSGSVTATYNVQVNDAVEFATAISTIAQFRAAVADGFNVTATPMEVSRLPNGKVSVSFSMKTATVVFNIK